MEPPGSRALSPGLTGMVQPPGTLPAPCPVHAPVCTPDARRLQCPGAILGAAASLAWAGIMGMSWEGPEGSWCHNSPRNPPKLGVHALPSKHHTRVVWAAHARSGMEQPQWAGKTRPIPSVPLGMGVPSTQWGW